MAHNIELGRRGEQVAAEHLEARGMRVLDRNWRCPQGELDLVLRDGDATVFVEVKTRTGPAFGHPFEAITALKLARLRRLALAWCDAHDAPSGRIRIDAVAVHAPSTSPAIVEHLEGIG
ncbi:YraN family protein [Agromyces sp. GXS1127]|uniref:YraN family protein n=1 Tax=Agromyces sp. GXS1127 TaxID=3424181 RepID=UPI003D31773B